MAEKQPRTWKTDSGTNTEGVWEVGTSLSQFWPGAKEMTEAELDSGQIYFLKTHIRKKGLNKSSRQLQPQHKHLQMFNWHG